MASTMLVNFSFLLLPPLPPPPRLKIPLIFSLAQVARAARMGWPSPSDPPVNEPSSPETPDPPVSAESIPEPDLPVTASIRPVPPSST
jgi:hypothetical protein